MTKKPNKCIHRIVKIVAIFAEQKVTRIFTTADARRYVARIGALNHD